MTEIAVEIYRDDEWKPLSRPDLDVAVSGGRVTVSFSVGYLEPPWRILRDGEIVFERAK